LESHQANQIVNRDKLKNNIAYTQRQIDAKIQAQREYAEKIDGQSRLNGPELYFWETYLGCRIEGAGDDCMVKIIYTFAPARGSKDEREASFELQVPESGGGGYQVVHTRPKLDTLKVDRVVDRLNQSRDIATLLKGMRNLFADEMK
jgi:kinetochore protein Spc25